jgi:hypothetical protein
MAKKIEISCVVQKDSPRPYERVISVGGVYNDIPWQMTQQAVVDAIEHGKYVFYITIFNTVIDVTVAEYNDRKYLSTREDVGELCHLLTLPTCPFTPPAKKKKATTSKK